MPVPALTLCALALAPTRPHEVHPQDGPDADVRILIEDELVEVRIQLNLAFVDEIIELTRENEAELHPEEYGGMHDELFDYFERENRVLIDGVEVAPVDAGFDVDPGDPALLPLFPRMGTKALVKVQLVLEYPAESPPRSVALKWGPYPPDVVLEDEQGVAPPLIVTAQLTAEGEDQLVEFSTAEPEFTWHRKYEGPRERLLEVPAPPPPERWKVPAVSAGFAGLGLVLGLALRRRFPAALASMGVCLALAALARPYGVVEFAPPFAEQAVISEDEALAIFEPLHANIYRAFDYRDEESIYDALARSVEGPLLDDLYGDVYQSLILQEEGGAVCRIQRVEQLSAEVESVGLLPPDDAPGFSVATRWEVEGSVYHWGHSHTRLNQYHARYTVVRQVEGWRIRANQVLEHERIDTSTDPQAPGAAAPPAPAPPPPLGPDEDL